MLNPDGHRVNNETINQSRHTIATPASELRTATHRPCSPNPSAQSGQQHTAFEEGEETGVLILQMPIDRINTTMTHGGKWAE